MPFTSLADDLGSVLFFTFNTGERRCLSADAAVPRLENFMTARSSLVLVPHYLPPQQGLQDR